MVFHNHILFLYISAVDECSPPKAKRVMVSQNSFQPASRVFQNQTQKQLITPNKRKMFRSHSHSETSSLRNSKSNSFRDSDTNRNVKCFTQKNLTNSKSAVLQKANVHTDEDDKSPDRNIPTGSRFSQINDTITKSKKYSHLYVRPTCQQDTEKEYGKESLDDTFTIDPSVNPLPESAIPHVDDGNVRKCDIGSRNVCGSVIAKGSCKCAQSLTINGQTCSRNCHSPRNSVPLLNCSQANKSCESQGIQSETSHIVEPAENYSYCVDEPQIGSQPSSGENDSGTSTLVDQSNNSVGSLASVSTLVDGGQNLSQNLSGLDDKADGEEKGVTNNKHVPSTSTEKLHREERSKSKVSSTTVIKPRPDVLETKETASMEKCVNKAIRSIKFDNTENAPSPSGGGYS